MNHFAKHYHGTEPLAFPVAGRAIITELKRQERRPRKWERHHTLFIVLFFVLALSIAMLIQAIQDFNISLSPHPSTPAPTPTPAYPQIQFRRTDPGEPIDFTKTLRI